MSLDRTVTLDETNDGELFLEIPDELFELLGWDEGTIIQWDVVGDSIRISRALDDEIGEALLPEQSRVERSVQGVPGGDTGVQQDHGDVVGEPSF